MWSVFSFNILGVGTLFWFLIYMMQSQNVTEFVYVLITSQYMYMHHHFPYEPDKHQL